MTVRTTKDMGFSRRKGRKIAGRFGVRDITSDKGVLLPREVERKLRLTERMVNRLVDSHCKKSFFLS